MGTTLKPVLTTAADGTPLEGLLTLPDVPKATAFFITHGIGGSFEGAVPGWFGREAAPYGYATLSLNRRDFGGNHERSNFENGLEDLRAGLDLLTREGFRHVFLCGHSKGSAYLHPYMAQSHDARVTAIGLFSAVHDMAAVARDTFMRDTFDENLRLALSASNPEALMQFDASMGPDIVLSPRGFLSYYGPDSLARPVDAIARVSVPTLSCWCSTDAYTPEANHLALVAAARQAGVPIDHVVIRDQDPFRSAFEGHCYVGQETDTMGQVIDWFERTV